MSVIIPRWCIFTRKTWDLSFLHCRTWPMAIYILEGCIAVLCQPSGGTLPGRRPAEERFILEDIAVTKHDEQQTTSGLSQSDKSDQRSILASPLRRRLVKGTALALPAIITLPRAEAQAMVSVTCRAKEGAAGDGTTDGATVVTTTDDGYARQIVNVYESTSNVGVPKYYYDSVMNVYRNYSTGADLGATQPTDLGTQLTGPYYALAFVDGTGQVTALGPGTVPSAPVSDTCFASAI
jgi:hypothetical protein